MATIATYPPTTAAEVLALTRLDPADTQAQTDVATVLAYEPAAQWETLRPDAVGNPALADVLRRGVARLCAAEVLEMRNREEGASGSFAGDGLTLGAPPDWASLLRAEGRTLLEPYLVQPLTLSAAETTARAALIHRAIETGQLMGSEPWLPTYLGLPASAALATPPRGLRVASWPLGSSEVGAAFYTGRDGQTALWGPSEAVRVRGYWEE